MFTGVALKEFIVFAYIGSAEMAKQWFYRKLQKNY